jgi:hypothetical protein
MMNIQLKDVQPSSLPQPQAIFVAGREVGDVTPSADSWHEGIHWHAVIKLEEDALRGSRLLQGFGPTPEAAVADAILNGRREHEAFMKSLARIENAIGTSTTSDAELQSAAQAPATPAAGEAVQS